MANVEPMDQSRPLIPVADDPRFEIDPEIEDYVNDDDDVAEFLQAIQTVDLPCGYSLTPIFQFYLASVGFSLPAIWSVVSVLLTSHNLPAKLFFDYCVNASANDTLLDQKTCLQCSGWESYVFSNSSTADQHEVSSKDYQLELAAIIVSSLSAAIAAVLYSRLAIGEFLAIQLVSLGVVIDSTFSCMQYMPVFIAVVLFSASAALDVAVFASLGKRLDYLPLLETNTTAACRGMLYARFHSGNPSLASSAAPTDGISYLKAIVAVLVPFLPVILKLHGAASSTITMVRVDDLLSRADDARDLFAQLYYSVKETDLLDALEEFAKLYPREKCSCVSLIRRIVVMELFGDHPPSMYFRFMWGTKEEEGDVPVKKICSYLKRQGKLHNYQSKVLKIGGKDIDADERARHAGDDEEEEEEEEEQQRAGGGAGAGGGGGGRGGRGGGRGGQVQQNPNARPADQV